MSRKPFCFLYLLFISRPLTTHHSPCLRRKSKKHSLSKSFCLLITNVSQSPKNNLVYYHFHSFKSNLVYYRFIQLNYKHDVINARLVLAHAFLACHQRRGGGSGGSTMKPSISQQRQQQLQQYKTRKLTSLQLSSSSTLSELEMIDTLLGSGDEAKFDTIVTIRYTGKFYESGDEFDASTISFKLGYGKVLDGCDTGIRGMKVGGRRILKIPSRLGFGVEGMAGPDYTVPPNTDLEYNIELLSVASGPMAEAAAKMGIGLDPSTVYLR